MQTSDVIITDERIEHIRSHHPRDYERYSSYLKSVLEDPDYILEANRPNTAFVLRQFAEGDKRFQLILRLATSSDEKTFSNSIITFLKIEEKKWNKYIRNKKILYRRTVETV